MAEIKIQLLEVDLTSNTSKVIDVTDEARTWIGGIGLATKLIWDTVPQGTDPLSPANILHIGVGPMTGMLGSRAVVSYVSPLTNWMGRGTCGGDFGYELVKTHFNAGILVKGKASKPVYLYVKDDQVEIRDASELWGMYKTRCEMTLKEKLYEETGEHFSVMTIGPAGENMVRYANISTQVVHSVSKWGAGAVMGSKNLKAVAVRGTKGPLYSDHSKVWELLQKYALGKETMVGKAGISRVGGERYGLVHSTPGHYLDGSNGIKNAHKGWDEICTNYNDKDMVLAHKTWMTACTGCVEPCWFTLFKRNQEGAVATKIIFDNSGSSSANWMLDSYEKTLSVAAWLEEIGLDAEENGSVVGFAFDCYEHGIISKEDLDGIDLKWGDLEASLELMKKIAYRQGKAPNALADGLRRAYKVFGEESVKLGWEVHGCGIPTHNLRTKKDEYYIPRFAANHSGARIGWDIDYMLWESATTCSLIGYQGGAMELGGPTECIRKSLNAVCGWNLSESDIKDMALRIYYFNRCLSLREGYHPDKDTYLPERAFTEPLTDRYGNTSVLDRDHFMEITKAHFVNGLKLTERGLPPRSELERLGLDFVVPVLEPLDAIG
ncbi:MAG: aldehyde ferredoxin oxidoreductase N-terminal domain-containing protein [Dehalococcoidales bacterium]|jgi:aldehyde:ferredoxin oxidoreductase